MIILMHQLSVNEEGEKQNYTFEDLSFLRYKFYSFDSFDSSDSGSFPWIMSATQMFGL